MAMTLVIWFESHAYSYMVLHILWYNFFSKIIKFQDYIFPWKLASAHSETRIEKIMDAFLFIFCFFVFFLKWLKLGVITIHIKKLNFPKLSVVLQYLTTWYLWIILKSQEQGISHTF